MATAIPIQEELETQEVDKYAEIGVLAGLEWSPDGYVEVDDDEQAAIKERVTKAAKRDYPARLIEVIQTWEAALFYRGFQFLVPLRGGGWKIPGESTGYGPSMQIDLSLLPTNVYSSQAQILISTLTRAVPNVRFAPQEANNDAQITASESAYKFIKVIERNIDLKGIQTDAARYLYTDGRFLYWNRFVKDGQRFGWEEDDEPDDIVPENEPATADSSGNGENIPSGAEAGASVEEGQATQSSIQGISSEGGQPAQEQAEQEGEEQPEVPVKRTPRGQEVRTAHGKLEFKLVPMMANNLDECDVVQYETEVSVSRAKGMFPWVADNIRSGSNGLTEGEIARLARLNVKLGMQSTYITSDSIADDVTIQRSWMRNSEFTSIENETVRKSLISKFPNGCFVTYAGETFVGAKNEGIEDHLALGEAFSGDGQNRNALGTSMLPIQKRINNWLDLMNDYFIRTVPKKWMHNKAFDVDAIRMQTNVPGDIGAYKPQPGMTADQLIFVEPTPNHNPSLPDFVKEYIGPISQLITGAYPALSGGDTGSNDTKGGIITQRNQALGRLGQTWQSIQHAEATSMRQLVRWGAKCRDKSINEKIPGGEAIQLEVNNLKANILCFAEADESFPESHIDKQNRLTQMMTELPKNPMLAEAFFNAANLEFLQNALGLEELYLPQVAARNKQLGEIEILLKGDPVPNPQVEEAKTAAAKVLSMGVDPAHLDPAQAEAEKLPPMVSSVRIDKHDDNETEAATCWQWMMSPDGRKAKRTKRAGYENVSLHLDEHIAAAQAKQKPQGKKPPSESINIKDLPPKGAVQLAGQAGIELSPGDFAEEDAKEVLKKKLLAPPKEANTPHIPRQPAGRETPLQ